MSMMDAALSGLQGGPKKKTVQFLSTNILAAIVLKSYCKTKI